MKVGVVPEGAQPSQITREFAPVVLMAVVVQVFAVPAVQTLAMKAIDT